MMKHYIKGGNETKKGNKKQLPKPITIIINKTKQHPNTI